MELPGDADYPSPARRQMDREGPRAGTRVCGRDGGNDLRGAVGPRQRQKRQPERGTPARRRRDIQGNMDLRQGRISARKRLVTENARAQLIGAGALRSPSRCLAKPATTAPITAMQAW